MVWLRSANDLMRRIFDSLNRAKRPGILIGSCLRLTALTVVSDSKVFSADMHIMLGKAPIRWRSWNV